MAVDHWPLISEGGRRCDVLVTPEQRCNLLDYEHPLWVAEYEGDEEVDDEGIVVLSFGPVIRADGSPTAFTRGMLTGRDR